MYENNAKNRKGERKYAVVRQVLCYLKVDSVKLNMHILNPRVITKNKTHIMVIKSRFEMKWNI